MADPALVDLRWLQDHSGASTVCRQLLNGLVEVAAHHPDRVTQLLLWGDRSFIGAPPDGAAVAHTAHHGAELRGQRDIAGIPPHRGALYLQQIRPLRDWNSATVIHDTIQLTQGRRADRIARRAFLRAVARRSRLVVAISDHSAARIVSELGASPSSIRRVRLPIDVALARRVRERRAELAPEPDDMGGTDLLHVSGVAAHKNHRGLLEAFARSGLDNSRRLHLFGPDGRPRVAIERHAAALGLTNITIADDRSADALVDAYARASTVVMASFDEGWGLPAQEAVAAGIPVVSSNAGALPEVLHDAPGWHRLVNVGRSGHAPSDDFVTALAEAPTTVSRRELDRISDAYLRQAVPNAAEFAHAMIDVIAELRD